MGGHGEHWDKCLALFHQPAFFLPHFQGTQTPQSIKAGHTNDIITGQRVYYKVSNKPFWTFSPRPAWPPDFWGGVRGAVCVGGRMCGLRGRRQRHAHCPSSPQMGASQSRTSPSPPPPHTPLCTAQAAATLVLVFGFSPDAPPPTPRMRPRL